MVSAAYDGSPVSGKEVILSGEGLLWSVLASSSSKPQGASGEPGLSTRRPEELIQGKTEGGAPARISSTSTLALYSHSQ
ncbi:hypothetical protein SLA2020_377320 [Shorea laevis]